MKSFWPRSDSVSVAALDSTSQSTLFGDIERLRWLPDESVFSLASRLHFLSGRSRSADTSRLLFGAERGGFPAATPGGVAHFANAFGQDLGTAREVLMGNTALPQLLAARPRPMQETIYQMAELGSTATLKAKLGLLASGFGGLLPLKACRSCLEEDMQRHGTGYWRTEHLLPGVWLCTRHGDLLEILASMRTGQARYEWSLPRAELLAHVTKGSWTPTEVNRRRLEDLARASVWLLGQGKQGGIDLPRFVSMLWTRLSEAGYAHGYRRLRQAIVSRGFSEHFDGLREFPELSRIATTPTIGYSQLMAVLQGRACGLHPLRVASVLVWLYPGSTQFSEDYEATQSAAAPTNRIPETTKQEDGGVQRRELVARVVAGESVSSAAKAIGVEVVTGQAWVAAAGIRVSVRPSTLVGVHRKRIFDALRNGEDKADVERRFGISASSVNRLLRTEVGLHVAWKSARESTCRARMRSSWLDQLSATGAGPKLARQLVPSVYAWLYRNDREWLRQVNLENEIEPKSNNARVDWDKRDRSLSQAILDAAMEIHDRHEMPIRLVEILARVPELKAKLPKLNRLPLTSRALDQVLKFSRRKRADGFVQQRTIGSA